MGALQRGANGGGLEPRGEVIPAALYPLNNARMLLSPQAA